MDEPTNPLDGAFNEAALVLARAATNQKKGNDLISDFSKDCALNRLMDR